MLRFFLSFQVFSLCSLAIFAQEVDSLDLKDALAMDLSELSKVKVQVSSVKPLDILSVPSSVMVVDREMIEAYNFQSLAEVLSIVPGIDVLQTVIDKNVTTSRGILQNFYANKVLFMINGISSWQPIYGDFHLERLDINDVERIEVLKGPASVLYGTNAYSGVVNIILRDKKKSTVDGFANYGYLNTFGAGLNTRTQKNDFSLYVSANARTEKHKSYSMPADIGFPYNGDSTFIYQDQSAISNFTLRGGYKAHSLTFNGFDYSHSYYGANPSYALGGGSMVVNQGVLAAYQLKNEFSGNRYIFATLSADFFAREFALSADRSNQVNLSGTRYSAEVKYHHYFFEFLSLDIGGHAEIRDSYGHETRYAVTDTLVRSNLTDDDNIYEESIFFQPEISWRTFSLMLGGRYTINSLFGDNLSLRVSSVYELGAKSSVKFIAGQSFRAPTMFEMYFDHETVQGNKDLKPETSNSFELAYLLQHRVLFLHASAYWASYSNLIKRVAVDGMVPMYQNVAEFEGAGIELELNYSKENIGSVYVNYNYISGYRNSGNENYKYVPEHSLSMGANKNIRSFFFYTKGQFVTETSGIVESIPAQMFIDFGFGFNSEFKSIKIKHSLEIKNITSSDFNIPQYIRESSGVNTLPTLGYGRSLVYSLNIRY